VKKKLKMVYKKTISWPKKSGKGRQEWESDYFASGMWHRKLKTHVKTIFTCKVIIFEKTIDFKNAIIFCYGRQRRIALKLIILKAQVWAIVEAVTSTLNLVIFACVMNQSRGHRLLSNALPLPLLWKWKISCWNFLLGLKYLIYLR
jgi:hypothetical protein